MRTVQIAQPVPRNQKSKDRHPHGAERNQAMIDFSARKITRRETPHANPDSHSGLQITDLRFVHVQRIMAIHDDHELQERRQKPQIGVAHDGPAQDAILRDDAKLPAKIGKGLARNVRLDRQRVLARSRSWSQSDHCKPEEHDAGPDVPASKRVGQKSREHHRSNRRHKSAEFDDAISPGKFVFREQFGQQAVLGRAEQRSLRADQKNGSGLHRQVARRQRGDGKKPHANFKKLGADRDAALAVAIGKVSAGQRK